MNFVSKYLKNKFIIIALISLLFIFKLFLNNFLMAENGDTYDFFKIAYELKHGNFLYQSKRLPLYSLLLTPFNPDNYVFYGRIINNLIYFLSVFFFYKLISLKFKLDIKEKLIFTGFFAFNFIIFDNSFFILSDSLLLMLSILFLYLYERGYSPYVLALIASLALNTRFEGALLALVFGFICLINKKYSKLIKFSILFILFNIPLILKLYLTSKTGANYLNDEVGFTLKYQNILKAFGSLLFGTGGFWLLTLFILDKKSLIEAKNPLKFLKKQLINPYVLMFIFFSGLLILWGFFIRLYTVPIFLSILYFIYLYKEGFEFSKNKFLILIAPAFYLVNIIVLRHFDLAYFSFGKATSILFSLLIIYILVFSKYKLNFKFYAGILLIILLNILVFSEKFITTRLKYYTLVQACEFVNSNNLENVAWFDESGVQKWYFKDFTGKFQYFKNSKNLDKWLEQNNIDYIMITDEMGYRIGPIMEANKKIKQLEKVAEFNSNFVGGRTLIYKLENHKLTKQ